MKNKMKGRTITEEIERAKVDESMGKKSPF